MSSLFKDVPSADELVSDLQEVLDELEYPDPPAPTAVGQTFIDMLNNLFDKLKIPLLPNTPSPTPTPPPLPSLPELPPVPKADKLLKMPFLNRVRV